MAEEQQLVAISITAEDAEWLTEFGHRLVIDGLAACVNVTPEVESVYRWEDKVEHATEALAVIHTRAILFDRVADRADREHPYDVPQLLAVPIVHVTDGYRQWVLDSTRPDAAPGGENPFGVDVP